MNLRTTLRNAFAALLLFGLAGCGSMSSMFSLEKKEVVDNRPPDALYKAANKLLDKGSYTKAAALFEQIDQNYPYAEEAKKAMLLAAFAYQKAGKAPEAVAAARRYLELHPGSPEAAAAQNIIATSYYDREVTANRDQGETKKAVTEEETLLRRYPDSKYATETKKQLKLSQDKLAASEMSVARFYQDRGNYLAAINRYKTVVQNYQQTTQVEEALYRIVECYMALGITGEAENAAAILGHNYPDSPWYKDAYGLVKTGTPGETPGSWLSRQWKKVAG